jgi:hypothetical protein
VTLAPKGLLIEEQRTNLVTYSEQFDNAAWTKLRASVNTDQTTSPDGIDNADAFIEDSSLNTHLVFSAASVSLTSGTSYSLSLFVKANGRTQVRLAPSSNAPWSGTSPAAIFDLSTQVISGKSATVAASSITDYGNGWYRCSLTSTATTATANSGPLQIQTCVAGAVSYQGDGTSGVYIWGAQAELGAFSTSYIPSVASQVTRAADNASMIGNNFARWYNVNAWTLYAEAENRNGIDNSTNYHFASISAGANANSQITRLTGDTNRLQTFGSNGGTANQWALTTTTAIAKGAFAKIALGYALNDVGFTANAGAVLTDSLAQIPFQNVLNIGATPTNAQLLNGCIKRIAFYPRRLADSELIGITS